MSLQEEELVSSHAGQPEQASSLLDQIMHRPVFSPVRKVMTLPARV
ncbi:type VI secretion protein EvpB [Escherichia coli]|uniref:Type VI secretion protein EvpB n=1 Tax=Escherichia coli TaxID=562 RepID=A0A2X1LIX5_ECOLX|nr:type VI secretion protein EvpB [Escherichia coli]